jgi:hypothetical protein
MIDDVMTDRLLYEREHRMNSALINDNSMLRAVHQDDKAKIKRLEDLVSRELPFARAEGRKTWVSDAAHELHSSHNGEGKHEKNT